MSSTASLVKCSRKFKSDGATNQEVKQQGAQFDQQQKLDGPSCKLDEVLQVSRSQSLSSLYPSGSGLV
ncbi:MULTISPECIES: hypothetical protein [Wolbachia]|uniref:Uncharacterized protein n=1 Tax=Wolbachia pipientis TaxID=955 RepID=A0A7G5CE28_WOLPI|nr:MULTISPECIES: hypothetical protein [Wolbachia]MDE5060603.1 hypothetical protein [Wolbachia endosymbiont of Drosophila nikananu]MDE5061933.1 hypothetical protein [Wolbachia endosymbiont of Drosophila tsacasi]QMV47462.1 hypothetical protein HC356_05785 [Wolbachia pipientis]